MHFGLRGQEVQVRIKKTYIEFKSDNAGEFIELSTDFVSKNCPSGIAGHEFNTVGHVDDPRQVVVIRLLVKKADRNLNHLFQLARMGKVKTPMKFGLFVNHLGTICSVP